MNITSFEAFKELARRGARVDVVEAYRTLVPEGLSDRITTVFAHKPACITFMPRA